jgi:hypothetical protein
LLKPPGASLSTDFVSVEHEPEAFYLNGLSVLEFAVLKGRFETARYLDVERFIPQIDIVLREVSGTRTPLGHEHATDSFEDVGLASIVWPYDRTDLRQLDRKALERPEVLNVERFQSHPKRRVAAVSGLIPQSRRP